MTVSEVVKQASSPRLALRIKENVRKCDKDRGTGEICKKDFEDIFDCIAHGFVWDQTPEGFKYWANIAIMYISMKGKKV